jgi:hypothetical protein
VRRGKGAARRGRSAAQPGSDAGPPGSKTGDWSAWQPATPAQPRPLARGPAFRPETDPGDPWGDAEPGGTGQTT